MHQAKKGRICGLKGGGELPGRGLDLRRKNLLGLDSVLRMPCMVGCTSNECKTFR